MQHGMDVKSTLSVQQDQFIRQKSVDRALVINNHILVMCPLKACDFFVFEGLVSDMSVLHTTYDNVAL